VRTAVYLPKEVLREAQELGFNVSKTCEIVLKQAIEHMKALYGKKE
jgi:post-segregation antitoxin (ccd killing protein)